MNPAIIMLNGPPGSGKDTAAGIIKSKVHSYLTPVVHEKLALPIKLAAQGTFNLPTLAQVDEHKDLHRDLFLGYTSRKWQIAFSEQFMKPLHGEDVFSKLLCKRIDLGLKLYEQQSKVVCTPVIVVSDCGFTNEYEFIRNAYGTGRVILIHMYRNDCSFDNDSREYVDFDILKDNYVAVSNHGSLEELESRLVEQLAPWIQRKHIEDIEDAKANNDT